MNSPFDVASKVAYYPNLLNAYKTGLMFSPVTIEFDLTDRCPHRCPRCAGGKNSGELTTIEALNYLGQIASFGVKAVTFTGGGEPTVHRGLEDALWEVNWLRMESALITNGWNVTESLAKTVAQCCTWVRVSVDGATPEQYEHSHGMDGSHLERAWESVAVLANARDRSESNRRVTVGVGYLVDSVTKPGAEHATRRAKQCGANYIQFRPFHLDATPIEDIVPVCKSLESMDFRVLASMQKYSQSGLARNYTLCHGSWFTGVIQANADVAFCCHLRGQPEWSLGNLRNAKFADIWHGPRRDQLVRQLDVTKCLPLCRHDATNRWIEQTDHAESMPADEATHVHFL